MRQGSLSRVGRAKMRNKHSNILQNVRISFNFNEPIKKARQLLGKAKRKVEKLIEEN